MLAICCEFRKRLTVALLVRWQPRLLRGRDKCHEFLSMAVVGPAIAAIRENSAWRISVQRVPVVVAAACAAAFLIKSMVFGDMFRAPLEIHNARC